MKRPEWPTVLVLFTAASLAVGPRFVLPVLLPGLAKPWWEPLQQACLLLALLISLVKYGRHRGIVPWPALVSAAFLVLSPLILTPARIDMPSATLLLHALSAWVVLALPWLAVLPRHQPGTARWFAGTLACVAVLSALLGLILQLLTDWHAYQVWYDTLYRFAGATRADYFAALAYGGVIVAVHEWNRRGGWAAGLLVTLNAILLIFSGSRTALIALGVWLCVYVLCSQALRARLSGARAWLWIAVASIAFAFVFYFPVLRNRMSGLTEGQLSLSGREPIWDALLGHFRSQPWIGMGLGSAQPGVLHPMLPHNEYLRLLVETGVIGTVLYLGAILFWVSRVNARLQPVDRPWLSALMIALPLYALTDNPISACYITPFLYLGTLLADPPAPS